LKSVVYKYSNFLAFKPPFEKHHWFGNNGCGRSYYYVSDEEMHHSH